MPKRVARRKGVIPMKSLKEKKYKKVHLKCPNCNGKGYFVVNWNVRKFLLSLGLRDISSYLAKSNDILERELK